MDLLGSWRGGGGGCPGSLGHCVSLLLSCVTRTSGCRCTCQRARGSQASVGAPQQGYGLCVGSAEGPCEPQVNGFAGPQETSFPGPGEPSFSGCRPALTEHVWRLGAAGARSSPPVAGLPGSLQRGQQDNREDHLHSTWDKVRAV